MYTYNGAVAPYLHELTYDDYVYDDQNHSAGAEECFGCSSSRNGNFIGRNLDLVYNDNFEAIVHMNAKNGRYASIGIACHTGLREQNMLDNKYDKELELLPNHTYDGINENGVYCNCNVVPAQDTAELTGTNPGAPTSVFLPFLVRYVLDNAKSADHAVELLNNANVYGKIMNYSGHYMICDNNKTYIVEFLDNKLVALEKQGDQQIMTNFYCDMDGITENACGVERYKILKENYSQGQTFDGMFDLMQRVKYSNVYKRENISNFKSEYLTQSQIQNISDPQKYVDKFGEVCDEYQKMLADNNRQFGREAGYWITVHNTTYDLQSKTMQIVVQEDYDHKFTYTLN